MATIEKQLINRSRIRLISSRIIFLIFLFTTTEVLEVTAILIPIENIIPTIVNKVLETSFPIFMSINAVIVIDKTIQQIKPLICFMAQLT